ncbi:hypothetical protein AMS68_004298 [Peltaster fructicola]|uniref:Uncharacterized protein n=1 Tax=Peltaster fructicola TaxID=286661 RepID=A0A6H0XVU5_9PEZI|nr:hypothetical protein AMS68_004298 [Peltaster fructicola]
MSNDPFVDGALRPTTSNATSLRSSHPRPQASQTSLRSGAGSAASTRTRQTREHFAPSLSRRAPSRALRRVEDDVLADSDSERDNVKAPSNTRLRRVRRLSPDTRTKPKPKQEEEISIVHRQPDGNFIREIPGEAEALKRHLMAQELLDEEQIKGELV